MISVDLNCDLGESFGAYTIGMDEAVIPLITSANVACGYHAGDPLVMATTVARCREAGVHVGAHPGFPDLMGFGRRSMNVSPAEAKAYIQYQLGALTAFCRAAGVPLRHVKPHGALYNMAAKDEKLARAVVEGVKATGVAARVVKAGDNVSACKGLLTYGVAVKDGKLTGMVYQMNEGNKVALRATGPAKDGKMTLQQAATYAANFVLYWLNPKPVEGQKPAS